MIRYDQEDFEVSVDYSYYLYMLGMTIQYKENDNDK